MNNLVISGRLIKEPELKNLENDNSLCTFFIANDVHIGSKKRTGFFKCSAFGKTGQSIAKFAKTGTELYITGRLDQFRFDDKSGKTNYNNSILVEKFDFGNNPRSDFETFDQQVVETAEAA